MFSTDPIPKLGVVAKGRANTCLGPFTLAVLGAPQSNSDCVSILPPVELYPN